MWRYRGWVDSWVGGWMGQPGKSYNWLCVGGIDLGFDFGLWLFPSGVGDCVRGVCCPEDGMGD